MIHAALWNGAVHSNARSSLKKFGCTVRKEADFASADEVGNVVQHQNAEDDDWWAHQIGRHIAPPNLDDGESAQS